MYEASTLSSIIYGISYESKFKLYKIQLHNEVCWIKVYYDGDTATFNYVILTSECTFSL